jgi:hypothetical protein
MHAVPEESGCRVKTVDDWVELLPSADRIT